jgi:hypothetical protein
MLLVDVPTRSIILNMVLHGATPRKGILNNLAAWISAERSRSYKMRRCLPCITRCSPWLTQGDVILTDTSALHRCLQRETLSAVPAKQTCSRMRWSHPSTLRSAPDLKGWPQDVVDGALVATTGTSNSHGQVRLLRYQLGTSRV